jgi:hypothetical protein
MPAPPMMGASLAQFVKKSRLEIMMRSKSSYITKKSSADYDPASGCR